MGWYAKERAVERIARAAGEGLDVVGFWEEAREALASAIPHHIAPCWYTLDPASLLVTSHYDHGMIPQLPSDWLAHEYQREDCHKLAGVARAKDELSTLHEATGGDPSTSSRWQRYVAPYGGDQELLLALRTRTGEPWGVLALYRAPGQPVFSPEERELLRALAPHLAEGARRGLLVGEATEPEQPAAPGLVVLTETFETESLTPALTAGCKSCLAASESTTRCLTPSSRSPARRSERRRQRSPARSRSPACSRAPDTGSCSTEPSCNPAAARESP
jgi:hypothetical protein